MLCSHAILGRKRVSLQVVWKEVEDGRASLCLRPRKYRRAALLSDWQQYGLSDRSSLYAEALVLAFVTVAMLYVDRSKAGAVVLDRLQASTGLKSSALQSCASYFSHVAFDHSGGRS